MILDRQVNGTVQRVFVRGQYKTQEVLLQAVLLLDHQEERGDSVGVVLLEKLAELRLRSDEPEEGWVVQLHQAVQHVALSR